MKTLRREIIIRDSDLGKVLNKSIKNKLYDRYEIEPMTYQGIQHENLITKLINPQRSVPPQQGLPRLYEDMLFRERILYDKRYLGWTFSMDYPAGQIYVQTRSNQPKEPLYRVTVEKDIA